MSEKKRMITTTAKRANETKETIASEKKRQRAYGVSRRRGE
jgi:hypothetical protein